MSVSSEVKQVARNRWVGFFVGVLVGGTLLALPVMWLVGKIAPSFGAKLIGYGSKLVPGSGG